MAESAEISGDGAPSAVGFQRLRGFHEIRGLRPVSSAAGWETWRFLPETGLSRWHPHGKWTVTATAADAEGHTVKAYTTFQLRRVTGLRGVAVNRVGDRVRVSGSLMRLDPLGPAAFRPFRGQPVVIRQRRTGSEVWRQVAKTVTSRDGWFDVRVRPIGEGLYRAEFPGTPRYAPDTRRERSH
ncbi:hypothetical protein [Acrocarpospora catenulata]|uniref:hypothetical protein n=1 Tax=Acrocarpospora catenulata TaxID=2836182 RepID=UPI001BD9B7EE|nr:hypothetical protein [Acrocarpospora catenulata]